MGPVIDSKEGGPDGPVSESDEEEGDGIGEGG